MTYEFYASGRQKSTNRSFSKRDVKQFLKLCAGGILRNRFYSALKATGEMDLSLVSPLLSIQEFTLSDPNAVGMRRADMGEFDLLRMPHSSHITNIIPLGCESESPSIPLVEPGEEYFYLGPKFNTYKFGVVKGRGINTYRLPPCAKSIAVETTYIDGDSDIDPDISPDIAFEASNETLGRMIGIPDFINKGPDNPYTLPQKNLKQRIQPQQQPQE